MKKTIQLSWRLLSLLFLCSVMTAQGVQPYGVYLQVKGYNWKEYDGGRELLEESGPLFGIGLRVDPNPLRLSFEGKLEAYFGEVSYDGETFDGEPVDDRTAYTGGLGEFDVTFPAWVNAAKSRACLLFAGGGAHVWQRDLGQSNEDLGYTEEWMMFYGRLGGGFYTVEGGRVASYVAGGLKLPFYTSNGVSVEDAETTQDVTLEPKGQPGPFLEAGWCGKKYFANAFYEYIEMDTSDPETITVSPLGGPVDVPFTLYQPESHVHTFGVNVGMYF